MGELIHHSLIVLQVASGSPETRTAGCNGKLSPGIQSECESARMRRGSLLQPTPHTQPRVSRTSYRIASPEWTNRTSVDDKIRPPFQPTSKQRARCCQKGRDKKPFFPRYSSAATAALSHSWCYRFRLWERPSPPSVPSACQRRHPRKAGKGNLSYSGSFVSPENRPSRPHGGAISYDRVRAKRTQPHGKRRNASHGSDSLCSVAGPLANVLAAAGYV